MSRHLAPGRLHLLGWGRLHLGGRGRWHLLGRGLEGPLGDQRGGSEWEPIKILLEGD
jgi:hypothetical protein